MYYFSKVGRKSRLCGLLNRIALQAWSICSFIKDSQNTKSRIYYGHQLQQVARWERHSPVRILRSLPGNLVTNGDDPMAVTVRTRFLWGQKDDGTEPLERKALFKCGPKKRQAALTDRLQGWAEVKNERRLGTVIHRQEPSPQALRGRAGHPHCQDKG